VKLGLALALFVAGCFETNVADGVLQCNPNPKRACPRGYFCAANQLCYRNGHLPDFGLADLSIADLDGGSLDGGSLKHRAEPCGPGDVCDTGQCVDGYCCNDPCGDPCRACNLPTSRGTCDNVPAGMTPVHSTCSAEDVTSCGRDGVCDGLGRCELWPDHTVCAAGTCQSGKAVNPSRCNGSGACVPGSTIDCDPYLCRPDGGVCYDSCTDNTQCDGTPCITTVTPGSCGPRSLGSGCASGADCKSGNCVDGLCCDLPQAMCQGCKACNVTGSEGHCANVATGTDPHAACAGVLCADKCAGGACRPAAATTACATSCANHVLGNRVDLTTGGVGSCSGTTAGVCNTTQMGCPGSLTCASATSCKQTCAADVDCIHGFYCKNGSCLAVGGMGATCARDVECQSNVCVNLQCVGCRTHADCTWGGCVNNQCQTCTTDQDCINWGWGGHCNTDFGCYCTTGQYCTNGVNPVCDTSVGSGECTCAKSTCAPNQACTAGGCRWNSGQPCLQPTDCASGSCVAGACQ
jgi:hypothetical protein